MASNSNQNTLWTPCHLPLQYLVRCIKGRMRVVLCKIGSGSYDQAMYDERNPTNLPLRRASRPAIGRIRKSFLRLSDAWVGFIVLFAAYVALSAQTAIAQTGPLLPPDSPQSGATILAKAAQTVGIRRCYAAVDEVSKRTFAGAQHADVVLDWDRTTPDDEPFFSLSGLQYADGVAALSLTTVPSPGGGCSMLVERISTASHVCREVAREELPGYQATMLVKGVTVYTMASRPRESVTLIDASPACVIVRRQAAFHWGRVQ